MPKIELNDLESLLQIKLALQSVEQMTAVFCDGEFLCVVMPVDMVLSTAKKLQALRDELESL